MRWTNEDIWSRAKTGIEIRKCEALDRDVWLPRVVVLSSGNIRRKLSYNDASLTRLVGNIQTVGTHFALGKCKLQSFCGQ